MEITEIRNKINALKRDERMFGLYNFEKKELKKLELQLLDKLEGISKIRSVTSLIHEPKGHSQDEEGVQEEY